MKLRNLGVALVFFLIFACSHQEEMVYVDPAWEPEVLMVKANEYLQQQDYDHAFDAFSVIYEEYPASRLYTDAVLGLAYIYGKNEQYEKQMDMLLTLVEENIVPTKIPAIYNQIAEFYEKTATVIREINPQDTIDLGNAIEFYQKAASYPLSGDSVSKAESFYKVSLIQFQLGHKEKGLATLEKITREFPGNPWAIQASNFLTTYEETGILPGSTIESEEAPILPGLEEEQMLYEGQGEPVEQLPALDDVMPLMEGDSAQTAVDSTVQEEPKSILEQIPDQKKTEATDLDSLLDKMDQ